MGKLSFYEFNKLYQEKVRDVFRYWTSRMQEELSKHCHAWAPGHFDFKLYLQKSSTRFFRAYCSIPEDAKKVCDVGGFWGTFPLTLSKLGCKVTMTETLSYYSDAFSDLFSFIRDNGVEIKNCDLFQSVIKPIGVFKFISILAVLEHYPHSLANFMSNIVSMMKEDTRLYIEVPNIAYWPKRYNLLRGKTPLPDIEDIYKSKKPFLGHSHEFTISELRRLTDLCNLTIIEDNSYNYSVPDNKIAYLIKNPIQTLTTIFFKNTRECLSICCKLATDRCNE